MDEDHAMAERHETVTQKVIRCRRFTAEKESPSSRYCSNTPKEELLLEHVREFEEQFVNVYGNRFLFLCPPNEYGVAKFLPSTIRPTHLAYKELYEVEPCAKFLADFFNYEELNPPDRYPSVIPAPHSVFSWSAGDCFDLSIALCSLLIGVGYDAYCVSGFAPRFITKRNEARSACPQLEWHEVEKQEDKNYADDDDDYHIPKKPPLKSEYQEAKRLAEAADKARLDEEEMKSDSEDDPSSEEDEYENRRIHCWVLVRKGSREVQEDMYVEATTGRTYDVKRCPYLKIDLIWNHRNLWVNMQICSAKQVELDLYNPRYFEYVMLEPEAGGAGGDGGGLDDGDGDHHARDGERAEQAAQILDMPPAWSERIDIPREKFHDRCFQGEKTMFYHKCKVEQYAPYTQDDGLVQRVTLYKDVRRQIPLEIRETFQHRRDRLFERTRRPMRNETVERFHPGRPSSSTSAAGGALKQFREINARRRELLFYNSRTDGLVECVEIIAEKMFEFFEDRDDRLIYHSVTLDPSLASSGGRGGAVQKPKDTYLVESWGEVPIRKMTQKYARNPNVPTDQDIHKICYFLAESKIRVDYHREKGQLTYKSVTYVNEDGTVYCLPRTGPQPTHQEAQKFLQMQASCKETLTESHGRTHLELSKRRQEEAGIRASRSVQGGKKRELGALGGREDVLEPSVYDLARESASADARREGAEEEKQEETASKVDVLAPYLVDFMNKETGYVQLDSLQAELVMKKCTQDFRKRLTDRAEIIQARLRDEQNQLRDRRAQMQRRGDNVEKEEREFERYQSQAMFRTQILEQRLARHEMQAIEKFQELERTLQEDPRLAAMWQREPAAMGK